MKKSDDAGREDDEVVVDFAMARIKDDFESWSVTVKPFEDQVCLLL